MFLPDLFKVCDDIISLQHSDNKVSEIHVRLIVERSFIIFLIKRIRPYFINLNVEPYRIKFSKLPVWVTFYLYSINYQYSNSKP